MVNLSREKHLQLSLINPRDNRTFQMDSARIGLYSGEAAGDRDKPKGLASGSVTLKIKWL